MADFDPASEPLGTADPRVRDINTRNFDRGVNSKALTWTDRFGEEHPTVYGMEQELDGILIAGGRIFDSEVQGRAAVKDDQYYYAASSDPNISKVLWKRLTSTTSILIAEDPSNAYVSLLGNAEDLYYIGSSDIQPETITPSGLVVSGTQASGGRPLTQSIQSEEAYSQALALQLSEDLIFIGAGRAPFFITPKGVLVPIESQSEAPGEIFLSGAAEDFYIHFKTAVAGYFIRWRFSRRVNAAISADSWQINGVDLALMLNGVSVSLFQFIDNGQVEIAIRRAQDGSNVLIGGFAHGRDELIEPLMLLVDGVRFEPSEIPPQGLWCNTVEMFVLTQLMNPDDLSNFAKRYTTWRFASGELVLSNRLEIEQSETLSVTYLGMLPLRRLSADEAAQVTTRAYAAPHFLPVIDVSGAHTWPENSESETISVWGDAYGGRIDALSGWDRPGRRSWVSSALNRNKIYFDVTGPTDVVPGDVISSTMKISAFAGVDANG